MEVIRNHSNEPAALALAVRRAGDKSATTTDDSVTVDGSTAAGARVRARGGAVAAAAMAGQLLPRGSYKVEASVHGPGHGGDGSEGGAGVLLMRRDAASRLLPYYSISRVVVV